MYWGGNPKPQKFPSGQIQRRHDGIQVDELPAVTEGVVAVQEDMAPGYRGDFLDQSQGLEIRAPLVLAEQPRQDRGIVVDDGIGDQPCALVADLDLDVGLASKFFFAADLCDGRAELMVGLNPVLRTMNVAL
jgi:hypothetical protein